MTLISEVVVENPVPVNVTEVPPAVVPLFGLIELSVGVFSALYSALLSIFKTVVYFPFTETYTGQVKVSIVVTSEL